MRVSKTKSHLTAIVRKTLPAPTRWLMNNEKIWGAVLDYGCGKCFSVNPPEWDSYDPHYRPNGLTGTGFYHTIICNYVLCTIPAFFERMEILRNIQSHLYPMGTAFISVRTDRPKSGWGLTARGTYQCKLNVIPPLKEIYHDSRFRVFELTRSTNLGIIY